MFRNCKRKYVNGFITIKERKKERKKKKTSKINV
jgi:hypothetical protein